MVAGISHEIRNPLGIIRSSAELLKKKVARLDPSNSIPDIIVEEAGRLNNIITEFLNFAKPREPNLTPSLVTDILGKNINFLEPQLNKQGHVVKKWYDEGAYTEILADPGMLYQAFLNLILNASQSMPFHGGKIHVEVKRDKIGGILVAIEDQGDGIPDDLLDKIWGPFFTTKEKGAGLVF